MYESHFGLSTPPFNLNPDPTFYFESRGHGHALSYLKYGVYQGEGFIVVTGEIGAGKTTLVRTLLSELDERKIAAAQIVSTQLEAGDLLRAVATAFGVQPKGLSKAELLATIEAFLTSLALQERRALLVVDEAQNLNLEAIEELRMLSNFQLGSHALLQSFLVGQPELRKLLISKPMEQLRQRVIASCHLGPMDAGETRSYVEHRLTKAGWAGNPEFASEAFAPIYEATGGIPRRVNLLCNRLLLAAYLSASNRIDGPTVVAVAAELLGEIGEEPPSELASAAASNAADASGLPTAKYILCAATAPSQMSVLVSLAQQFGEVNESPNVVIARVGDEASTEKVEFKGPDGIVTLRSVGLRVIAEARLERIAETITSMGNLLLSTRPLALVVAGADDVDVACAFAAFKSGVPLIHIAPSGASADDDAEHHTNREVINCLAGLVCTSDKSSPVVEGELPVDSRSGVLSRETCERIVAQITAWLGSQGRLSTLTLVKTGS